MLLISLNMASSQQKAFCVLAYAKQLPLSRCRVLSEQNSALVHREIIRLWVRQFQESGYLYKVKSPETSWVRAYRSENVPQR